MQNQMMGSQPFPNMFCFPNNNPMFYQNMNFPNNFYNNNNNNQFNSNFPLNNPIFINNNIQPNNFIPVNNNIQCNNLIQFNNNYNIFNNNNIPSSSFNQVNNNVKNINEINFQNYNNYKLDKKRKDIFPDNAKIFNILETENEIYIANTKKLELIKILKDDTSIIERINKQTEIPRNISQITQADAIIGIFDLNWIKYLGIVTFSEESATILNSKIYSIKSIELIQITKTKEFPYNDIFN